MGIFTRILHIQQAFTQDYTHFTRKSTLNRELHTSSRHLHVSHVFMHIIQVFSQDYTHSARNSTHLQQNYSNSSRISTFHTQFYTNSSRIFTNQQRLHQILQIFSQFNSRITQNSARIYTILQTIRAFYQIYVHFYTSNRCYVKFYTQILLHMEIIKILTRIFKFYTKIMKNQSKSAGCKPKKSENTAQIAENEPAAGLKTRITRA